MRPCPYNAGLGQTVLLASPQACGICAHQGPCRTAYLPATAGRRFNCSRIFANALRTGSRPSSNNPNIAVSHIANV